MTVRVSVHTLLGIATARAIGAAPDRLPVDPPFSGPMWSYVVPAVLFALALGATVLLYRHFAGRDR